MDGGETETDSTIDLYAADWDHERSRPGFTSRSVDAGIRLGGELLGATLYECPPGNRVWPYHLHYANEKMLLVLEGTPTLRTPDGERPLGRGKVVLFRRGAVGAHQLLNRSERPAWFLIVSTMIAPEVCEYPDSGKVGIWARSGPGAAQPPSFHAFYRSDQEVDYWEGET
jgi:uncharacterized cupin superfamily protein